MSMSYQQGQLIRRRRKRLNDVWEWRYRKYMADGSSRYARITLGTIVEYPTKKDVMHKVEQERLRVNSEAKGIFFKDIAKRYEEEVIPRKRPHTQTTDRANLRHLINRFGDCRMADITAGQIDLWINDVKSQGRKGKGGLIVGLGKPLSKSTRKHIKALAHHVWRQAMLWEYLKADVNPVEISRVTEGARPKKRSVIVEIDVYHSLLEDPDLTPVVKVMVRIAMFTGMRVSEILGLRWEDVDFKNRVLHVRRSVVGKNADETKNAASERDVPVPDDLLNSLRKWKEDEPVWGGWVFGSAITERPYHEMGLQQDHLKPAGERAGLTGLGWHSFRHTVNSLMKQKGATMEERKALLGHATDEMAQHYGMHDPALLKKTRKAQNKVVQMLKKTGTESR